MFKLDNLTEDLNPTMFESLDVCELRTYRESSQGNRVIIDKIINKRHLENFGEHGASKPLNLKIKDLMLDDIIKKIDTSLYGPGGKLEMLDSERAYGLFIVTGGEHPMQYKYSALFNIHPLAFYNSNDENFQERAMDGLLRQKTMLLEHFPTFKEDIVRGYYQAIASLIDNESTNDKKKIIKYLKKLPKEFNFNYDEYIATPPRKRGVLSELEKEIIKLSGIDALMDKVPDMNRYDCSMFCGLFDPESSKKGGFIKEYITNINCNLRTPRYYGDDDDEHEFESICNVNYSKLKYQIQYDQRLSECDREVLKEYVNYKIKKLMI